MTVIELNGPCLGKIPLLSLFGPYCYSTWARDTPTIKSDPHLRLSES